MTGSNTTDRHTPGPWSNERIWDTPETRIHARVEGMPMALAEVFSMRNVGEREANARLIAAAPELLASLKEMGDWIAAGLQASGEAWPDAKCLQHTEEIAARARAAIDKAEGRQTNLVCPVCGPTDEPCEHVPTASDFL